MAFVSHCKQDALHLICCNLHSNKGLRLSLYLILSLSQSTIFALLLMYVLTSDMERIALTFSVRVTFSFIYLCDTEYFECDR